MPKNADVSIFVMNLFFLNFLFNVLLIQDSKLKNIIGLKTFTKIVYNLFTGNFFFNFYFAHPNETQPCPQGLLGFLYLDKLVQAV